MTAKPDQKVVIAYPHPGTVSAEFMRSMLLLWRLDAVGGKRPDGSRVGGKRRILDGGGLLSMPSGAVIARTRNQIVREFLKLDAEWLLQIDTDMTFGPTLVEDLIDAAHPTLRPVVGGLCFTFMADMTRKLWPTLYSWIPDTNRLRRLTQYPANAMVPVAATGGACIMTHRSVLEAMAKRFAPPRPWYDETPFYQDGPDGKRDMATGDEYSEDITFCLRAQACGFPVFVHTGIKLGHIKEFEANEAAFIAECSVLSEATKPALPTYVVIASRNRPDMLENLRVMLAGQATEVFVFDNGYDKTPQGAHQAYGWPLHRMWNAGLDLAQVAADGQPYNVVVMNDDVEVGPDFLAQLEAGLRQDQQNWIAYPNHHGLDIGDGRALMLTNDSYAGQTMSGWAFMLRGEAGLRFDEEFNWWYGDSDIERRVRQAGKRVVCVGGCYANHLDPMRSTMEDPERVAQAEADEALFAQRWGLDPETLWLAQHKETV